jgi:pimeloyl-ACP methyl ester carboxylesterase
MPPTLSHHYVDVQGRRVRYRRGGDGPPVVLLHESPRSSAALLGLLAHQSGRATVFALDTPGCGDSDPLDRPAPEATDYADALADTLDALGLERFVLYGTHTGAAIAMALALRQPHRVARLVIDGLGVFDGPERAQLLDSYLPSFAPQTDGSHLPRLWARVRDQYLFFPWNHRGAGARLWLPLPPPEALQLVVQDLLRAGDAYRAPYAAAFRFRAADAVARLGVPSFIGVREDDMLLPHLQRLGPVPDGVHTEVLPAHRPAWGERLWAQLLAGAQGLPDAPAVGPHTLPTRRLGNAFVPAGPSGAGLHVRGAMAPQGLPLVLLHDLPGAARGLDRLARAELGRRPVIAPDLPGCGDSPVWDGVSTASDVAGLLVDVLDRLGIGQAEVRGFGAGSVVAAALAALAPQRFSNPHGVDAPGPLAASTVDVTPRPEGGHLMAAWYHARDEHILGPLWTRRSGDRHDCGDELDLPTIHQRAVDVLRQTPQASQLRARLLQQALA